MIGSKRTIAFGLCVLAALSTRVIAYEPAATGVPAVKPLRWQTDYAKAMKSAGARRQMMFVYFRPDAPTANQQAFESISLANRDVVEALSRMSLVQLPLNATITSEGKPVRLLDHGAFAELGGGAGLAIIDMAHPEQPYYGHVVTTLPLVSGKYYQFRPEHLAVALKLPPGTLTQRTMVFAVRIHPESPASTVGEFHPALAEEAESHSDYQAQIRVQGHHQWGSRFQRIRGRLPFNLLAREVVAESWPNERIMDAAVDCVDCWRQSSGHWSAVRARHPLFGYDMRRGSNGVWYATGIFGTNNM